MRPGCHRGEGPEAASSDTAFLTVPQKGDLLECRTEAQKWKTDIEAGLTSRPRSPGYTLLVFMENGTLCYANRSYGIEGDPIFVGVYSKEERWLSPQFEPCSIEPTGPAIFVGADKVSLSGRESAEWNLIKMASQVCYNPSVAITLPVQPAPGQPTQTAVRHNLSQSRVYRGTLQMGALFTQQHVQEFDIRPGGEEGGIIYNKGATGKGVAYAVSLVLYGFPRYLQNLAGGDAYVGRDLIHDQELLDRVGLVLGVGLTDPGRRFFAGGSFELMYGVNVIGVAEVFRTPELVELSVGDSVSGADVIRTRERWKTGPTFGVSVDLLYIKELFSGRITP